MEVKKISWKQKETTKDQPIPRFSCSASVNQNQAFFYGGQDEFYDPSNIYNDLTILNGDTLEWEFPTTTGDKPPALCGHTSILLKEKLYLFGGYDLEKYYSDIYVLDTRELTIKKKSYLFILTIFVSLFSEQMIWSCLEDSNGCDISPRAGHTATVISPTEFVVFGGHCDGTYFNDLHVYNCGMSIQ